MHYITAPQPLAAGLVKYGDFLAPPKGAMRYGYGCLLYSQYCDFSTQGALAACFWGYGMFRKTLRAAVRRPPCPLPAGTWHGAAYLQAQCLSSFAAHSMGECFSLVACCVSLRRRGLLAGAVWDTRCSQCTYLCPSQVLCMLYGLLALLDSVHAPFGGAIPHLCAKLDQNTCMPSVKTSSSSLYRQSRLAQSPAT